jgi:hypothetical protein
MCRFTAKNISKNIINIPVLGPKINIEKSQVGPLEVHDGIWKKY